MKRLSLLVCVFVVFLPILAISANWDSCADDLDSLRRAARDAADAANGVKSKSDDFENCKRYPDIYDLMRDRCRSKAYDYQSVLSNLEGELNTVNRRVRSVSSSCGMDLSAIGTPSYAKPKIPGSDNPMCDMYRSYRKKLPLKTLIKTCAQSMSEAECRKCLGQ